jgi:hypothetical protein
MGLPTWHPCPAKTNMATLKLLTLIKGLMLIEVSRRAISDHVI